MLFSYAAQDHLSRDDTAQSGQGPPGKLVRQLSSDKLTGQLGLDNISTKAFLSGDFR